MTDNDWPDEVKNLRRLTPDEAKHDPIPPQRAEEAQAEWKEQLKRDAEHPAFGLIDLGEDND